MKKNMGDNSSDARTDIFDETYAKLTIVMDSLDVVVVEESLVYAKGQSRGVSQS